MNYYKYITLIGLVIFMSSTNIFGQKAKKKTVKIRVEYFKNPDNSERLIATLRIKEKRYVPLKNVDVLFYSSHDTSDVFVEKIKSNEDGEAILVLNDNSKIFKDSSGYISLIAEYKGNSLNKEAQKSIRIRQVNMDVSFFQKDTTKYVEINVQELGNDGEATPIKEIEVGLYIKGTFSLLNISTLETDNNGNAIVEFPIDMPGDTSGVLTIVAKIDEHKKYGTVESSGKINWGIPVALAIEKQRGLGDTDAPLWMVYTLITLLSAVWFHYFYVIFLIVKIKLSN